MSDIANSPQFDLFFSFSTKDRRQPWFGTSLDVVSEFKNALERYRHPDTRQRLRVCTYDEDFELRAEVREAISKNIDQSRAFLFLSTSGAAGSDFVRFEVERAATTHSSDRLLAAIIDAEPSAAFPSVFEAGTHAADLSAIGCADLKGWRRRVELEAAKVAARVWDVPLQRIRDRFLIERRRQRLLRYGGSAVALTAISIAVAVGLSQYKKREAARVLSAHQQYAADMATVQRDWTDGHVDKVKTTLERYRAGNVEPDPRSFEWYTYWRVATAERLALGEFAEVVTGLAVAPGAPWLAFSADGQPIKIVNIEDGQIIATLSGATVGARSLVFTPNSANLAGIVERGLILWDVHNKTESIITPPEQNELTSVAFHPVSGQCVAVSGAGTLYKVAEGRLMTVKPGLFKLAKRFHLAFSSDGRFLLATGDDGRIHIVDSASYALRHIKVLPELRSNQDFVVSDRQAIALTGDHVTVIDLRTGTTEASRRLVNGTTAAGVAIDSSKKLLAVGDPTDQSVVIRELDGFRELGSVKGYRGWLNAIRFVPQSSFLAASSLAGDVKVWDLARIGSRTVREQPGTIQSILFLPKTQDIVTLDSQGWVRCWNTATLKEYWKRRIGEGTSWATMSLRGQHIAVPDDSTIRLLNPEDGNEVANFPGYWPLTSSSDRAIFAYVDPENDAVVVEQVASGVKASLPIGKPESGELDISAITLTGDGKLLLVATADGRVMLFDVMTKERKFEFQGHKGVISAVGLSPDERLFATGSSDQTVGLWDVTTGLAVATLEGHTASVQALAFSPDGKTLASGAQDGLIKFWNVHARLPTVRFGAHRVDLHPGVKTLTFAPAGDLLVSGGPLGTVILWEADAQN